MNQHNRSERPEAPPVDERALTREAWRIFQIMAEIVEGFERLSNVRPSVSMFGSARTRPGHPWYELTEEIAARLSEAGFAVLSGGGPGLMEAANKGASRGPSLSVGLNIKLPLLPEAKNDFQDVSLSFKHFFTRKLMFVKNASAYVVCPGGFGTLDELAEILTLVQTGKSPRIPIVLVGSAFWAGLIDWLRDTMAAEGNITEQDLELFRVVDNADEVVEAIFAHYDGRDIQPSAREREILLDL